jgi:hypothetical protein
MIDYGKLRPQQILARRESFMFHAVAKEREPLSDHIIDNNFQFQSQKFTKPQIQPFAFPTSISMPSSLIMSSNLSFNFCKTSCPGALSDPVCPFTPAFEGTNSSICTRMFAFRSL